MRGLLIAVALLSTGATAQTTPTASLSWNAVTTNTNGTTISVPVAYNVYQATQGQTLVKVQSGVTSTSATVTTGLTAGTTQCFAVTAVVTGVESTQSATACAAIASYVPNAPTQITVVVH